MAVVPDPAATVPEAADDRRGVEGGTLGRFVIEELLGAGGMGVVFAAHDPVLDRRVAVKLLRLGDGGASDHMRARLLREAQAMARLTHPNVVTVHEAGVLDHGVFIAMELVDGGTLRDWMTGERDWREVVDVFVAAGRGLAAAHAAGLVHRDFKPANVFVDRRGHVKVGDFGLVGLAGAAPAEPDASDAPAARRTSAAPPNTDSLTTVPSSGEDTAAPPANPAAAALASPAAASGTLTETGTLMGTPAYMAPEQSAGERVDASADQYAFCVSLREALTGERPGDAAIPARRPLPPRLRAIVARGLQRSPAARFPSMTALLAALERARRGRRHLAVTAGLLAAAIAAAALAFWLGSRGPSPREVAEAACAARPELLRDAWSAERRADIARALAATGVAHAADTAPRVDAALDRYATAWLAARTETCRATSVLHQQSPALMDLRMQCLDRRRDELAAFTTVLAGKLEATAADQALANAMKLSRIDDCARADQLQAAVALPADPAQRTRVEHALRSFADVQALDRLGRFADARATLARLTEETRELSYAPLESDLAMMRGWFKYRDEPGMGSEPDYLESLKKAVAGRDVRREQRAWRKLYELYSTVGQKPAEAEQLRRAAELALERAGRPAADWAEFRNQVVLSNINTGNLEEAERMARANIAEIDPQELWQHGVALDYHALALAMLHRNKEAVEASQAALAHWERTAGPRHPKIVRALSSLSRAHRHLMQYDEAEAAVRRSLDVLIAAHGPDSLHLAETYLELTRLGAARKDLDAVRRASGELLRITAVEEKADPTNWINWQVQAGSNLADAGATEEGIAILRRAIERAETLGDRKNGAIGLYYLGIVLNQTNEHAEALTRCNAAEAPMAERFGEGMRTAVWSCQGDALAGLGRHREAAAVIDKTLTKTLAGEPEPGELATLRYALARSVWATGERARALELADQAAADWSTPAFARERAKLDDWRRGKTR